MRTVLYALSGFALLISLSEALAGPPEVGIDAVMDFTPAGKKLVPPDEDEPAYYFPLPVGYEEKGRQVNEYQRKLPPPAQIEHLIARMLAQQHYLLANASNPPTIVLTFKWGYKAPNNTNTGTTSGDPGHTNAPYQPTLMRSGEPQTGPGGAAPPDMSTTLSLRTIMQNFVEFDPNEGEMNDLVAGRLVNLDESNGMNRNVKIHDLARMAHEPRWYLQITAIDYNDWKRKVVTPLWRENVSTQLAGHYLDEVLPTLVTTAGLFIGRPMSAPAVMTEPIDLPPGWVRVGKSVEVQSK